MSWFSRLMAAASRTTSPKPQRLDYLNEALSLERQGDFDAALTSYRLAMRDQPNDPRILQNMAIAFSRTGRMNEAIGCLPPGARARSRALRGALRARVPPAQAGRPAEAAAHLEAFLDAPPSGAEADRWVRHARQTLDELRAAPADYPEQQPEG